MPKMRHIFDQLWMPLSTALALSTAGGCASDAAHESGIEVGVERQALELGCSLVEPDARTIWSDPVAVDLQSTDPAELSVPQKYGSSGCSGFVGDISNPNGWQPNGLQVHGAGWVFSDTDRRVFGSASLCNSMTLEADVWGIDQNGIPTPLDSATLSGVWEPNAYDSGNDGCLLEVTFGQPANFATYRFVSRVSNSVTTYGMWVAIH
jgi:hypothetical protein